MQLWSWLSILRIGRRTHCCTSQLGWTCCYALAVRWGETLDSCYPAWRRRRPAASSDRCLLYWRIPCDGQQIFFRFRFCSPWHVLAGA